MSDTVSKDARDAVDRFLRRLWRERRFTAEQREHSYERWSRGGRAWQVLHQGGTGVMLALMWFHHDHCPGSKEWRPAVIIPALVAHSMSASELGEPDPPGWGDKLDNLGRPLETP